MAINLAGTNRTIVTPTTPLALNTIFSGSLPADTAQIVAFDFSITSLGQAFSMGVRADDGKFIYGAILDIATNQTLISNMWGTENAPFQLPIGDYQFLVYSNTPYGVEVPFKAVVIDHQPLPETELLEHLLVWKRNPATGVNKATTGSEPSQTILGGTVNVYSITVGASSNLKANLANQVGGNNDIFIFDSTGQQVDYGYYGNLSAYVSAGTYYVVIDGNDGNASATYDLSVVTTPLDITTMPVHEVAINTVYAETATTGKLVKFTTAQVGIYLEQFASADGGNTNGLIQLFDSNKSKIVPTGGSASGYIWTDYTGQAIGTYYALFASEVDFHVMVTDYDYVWSQEANAVTYDLTIERPAFPAAITPAPARSNVKFSQKSIKGLPEALAALASAVTSQGAAGSTALTDAIAAEVEARNGAISAAIAQEVLDRNSAISTAVQGVLGTAPEAFDTLKEIADYIAVNPSATVADAINAAIAAANAAVTALTAVVDAEKAYSDFKSSNALRLKGDAITLTGTLTDSKATVTTTHPVEMVLNYGFARVTNIVLGETYDLPVVVNAGVASIDFAGYEAEATDLTQFTGVIQYAYKVDATAERAAFAAL